MTITDTSVTLDTAWAEKEYVAFTAGTLGDIDAMVTEVESKLNRGTLSASTSPTLASVKRWLTRAKEELMQIRSFSFARRYAYTDASDGDYGFALPPDYGGGYVSLRDVTNDFKLKLWPAHIFDLRFPDVTEEENGKPKVFCIKGMELWVSPPCDGTVRLELEYERTGEDNTATDVRFLPEIERFRCCDYAIAEACESIQDWERAKWFREKWSTGLISSNKANARRKWAQLQYRAISILEEEAIRVKQST